MKNRFFLFIPVLIGLASCNTTSPKKVLIFSGEIEHPRSDTLTLVDKNQNVVHTMVLDKNHAFKDTIDIAEGFYRLSDGKESTKLYLKSDFNLQLTLNTEEFDESIVYTGVGEKENNYLAKKALLEEGFGRLRFYSYYAKQSEEAFLKSTDSLFALKTDLLEKTANLDTLFQYVESKSIEFEKLKRYAGFEMMKRYVGGQKGFIVSDNFPNAFSQVNLEDERLLLSSEYLYYIKDYLKQLARGKVEKLEDPILNYIETIDQQVQNPAIMQELYYHVGKWQLNYTEALDDVYKKITPKLSDKVYLQEVTDNYKKLKRIEKGAQSPDFEFLDINGNIVSLSDLRGKLVYIDIWATWCLPCLKEIPHLKSLEENFKGQDIAFVSICQSDTKERWENMIKEKELGGIQLFQADENHPFFQDYLVQGIPRFILLDKEGKIIDAQAKRPSNSMLKEEIESHL